jgi:hypothetical protein
MATHVRCRQRRTRDRRRGLRGGRARDRGAARRRSTRCSLPERDHAGDDLSWHHGAVAARRAESRHAGRRAGADRGLAAAEGRDRARAQPRQRAAHPGREQAAVRGARRLDHAARGRDGDLAEPAALPALQPGPGLGHARRVRAHRARSQPLDLDTGRPAHRSRDRARVRDASGSSSRVARALPRADVGAAARGGAARYAASDDHPDGLHDRAARRGVRGRGDPGRRARQRAAPGDRTAQGGRPHAAAGHPSPSRWSPRRSA